MAVTRIRYVEYLRGRMAKFSCTKYDPFINRNLAQTSMAMLKHSAVLIGLQRVDREFKVLMTLRKANLHMGGETCFPGGKIDDGDTSVVNSALREAEEEIGLRSSQVDIMGQMMPLISSEGYLVYAVVAIIDDDFKPQINHREVEEVFYVSLSQIIDGDNHRSKGHGVFIRVKIPYDMIDVEVNGHMYTIYGVTALHLLFLSLDILEMQTDCSHCKYFIKNNEHYGGFKSYINTFITNFIQNPELAWVRESKH